MLATHLILNYSNNNKNNENNNKLLFNDNLGQIATFIEEEGISNEGILNDTKNNNKRGKSIQNKVSKATKEKENENIGKQYSSEGKISNNNNNNNETSTNRAGKAKGLTQKEARVLGPVTKWNDKRLIGVLITVCNNSRNQKVTFEFDPNCDSIASVITE